MIASTNYPRNGASSNHLEHVAVVLNGISRSLVCVAMRLGLSVATVVLVTGITTNALAADTPDAPIAPIAPIATSDPPTQEPQAQQQQQTTTDPQEDTATACEQSTCRSRCCGRSSTCSCRKPAVSLSVSGIRPSLTHVATPNKVTTDGGVAFAGALDTYALDGTTHGSAQWAIGGGQAGFEGMLAGTVDVGYRVNVTKEQGPFGRAGFDGRMQGNDRYYFSTLELPRLTLGWQFLSSRTVLEFGARGGPILTGRFNPGNDGYRSLAGSLEAGAFASVQFDVLRVDATVMRIDERNTGDHTPIDVGRAMACGVVGKIGVCGDFAVMRGDADFGRGIGLQEAVATYAGVTVGVASW